MNPQSLRSNLRNSTRPNCGPMFWWRYNMSTEILMPALSPTMTEGKLARWTKKEGDMVKAGDVIAEIETDKATMEVEAVDEGRIGKLLIAEGTENVGVSPRTAVWREEGEDAASAKARAPKAQAPKAQAAPAATYETSGAKQPEGKIVKNRDILYAQGSVIE